MKQILLFLFLLINLAATAQDIISETKSITIRQDTVVCEGDTISPLYYLMTTTVIDNGTAYPDTTTSTSLIKRNLTCPADSAEVARQIYNAAINRQQEMAYYVGLALQRIQSVADFNNSSTLFEQVTGNILLDETSEVLFSEYSGTYRVFTSTSNFFADITRVGSGRWRLRQLDGFGGSPTGTTWVMNPRSKDNFALSNIDLGFGATNYEFFRDKRPGAESLFFPAQRVPRTSGAVRIAKVSSTQQ